MGECEHDLAFPIGGLGGGSIVFIDLESGKVRGYNNDYDDFEEIAESFSWYNIYNICYKGYVLKGVSTIRLRYGIY